MSPLAALASASGHLWPLLADHLWQATWFAALACVAAAMLRRGPARARYAVWLMVSLKLALPSCALVVLAGAAGIHWTAPFRPVARAEALPAIPSAIDRVAASIALAPGTASVAASIHDTDRPLMPILLTLGWAAGFVIAAGSWWLRWRRLSNAIHTGRVLRAGREIEALARAMKLAGSSPRMTLVVSPAIEQPGVCGVWRPRVVLPAGIGDRLSDAELEAVFLHELAHVRRLDNLAANLQMMLCCLFWFYPVVWLVDRRLLIEREQACDDDVLGHSCARSVYASSLLKVCTYCLGPRLAGLSAAAGTALRDRVSRIATGGARSGLNGTHRTLLGAAAGALVLFVAAGALGAAPGDGRAPEANRHVSDTDRHALWERVRAHLASAPPRSITFENPPDAPLVVRDAAVRVAPLDGFDAPGDAGEVLVTAPTFALENLSDRPIRFVRVGYGVAKAWNDSVRFRVTIAPRVSYTLEPDWRSWSNTVPADQIGRVVARVVGVQFEDGGTWGFPGEAVAPVAAPAAAPSAAAQPAPAPSATPPPTAPRASTVAPAAEVAAASYAARFENPPGVPVVIVDARTSAAAPEIATGWGGTNGVSSLPVVRLLNTTTRRVTELKLRFKANRPAHAVSSFAADIAPQGTYVFRSEHLVEGDPADMRVQLLGVRFEDGSIWGAFDTVIDTREETIAVPQSIRKPDR